MPKSKREYDADADQYREFLQRRREVDEAVAAAQAKANKLSREAAAEGVHPGVIALGRKIERIKDPERRREFIREAAKLLIDCEDALLGEQQAGIGHNSAGADEEEAEPESAAPFGQQRRTAAA